MYVFLATFIHLTYMLASPILTDLFILRSSCTPALHFIMDPVLGTNEHTNINVNWETHSHTSLVPFPKQSSGGTRPCSNKCRQHVHLHLPMHPCVCFLGGWCLTMYVRAEGGIPFSTLLCVKENRNEYLLNANESDWVDLMILLSFNCTVFFKIDIKTFRYL